MNRIYHIPVMTSIRINEVKSKLGENKEGEFLEFVEYLNTFACIFNDL